MFIFIYFIFVLIAIIVCFLLGYTLYTQTKNQKLLDQLHKLEPCLKYRPVPKSMIPSSPEYYKCNICESKCPICGKAAAICGRGVTPHTHGIYKIIR